MQTAQTLNIPLQPKGCYLCCDGPRFETPAEVRLFAQWGADVVGMTGLPEAIYAREIGIEYAGLGIVTNLGTGLSDHFDHTEVEAEMKRRIDTVRTLLIESIHAFVR